MLAHLTKKKKIRQSIFRNLAEISVDAGLSSCYENNIFCCHDRTSHVKGGHQTERRNIAIRMTECRFCNDRTADLGE